MYECIATVTVTIEEEGIYEALMDHKLIPLKDCISDDFDDNGTIFLNGRLIGIHKNPPLLTKIMKLLKLNSLIV